jgi:hypothetical protein
MGIVYLLSWTNLGYVGSTMVTLEKRMKVHHRNLKQGRKKCGSYDIIKNEGYEITVIEEVRNETEEECKEREQFWIEFYSDFGKLENHNNAYGKDIEKIKRINKNFFEKNPNYHKENEYKYTEKRKEQQKRDREKINERKREQYHLKKLSFHNVNGEQD